ncbi:MAG: hypothetical protein GOU98_00985 [Candidatus Altiarchaeota archaeon]|nr:hypothetical protein [Candidatus Altiarchaeota archaeon]
MRPVEVFLLINLVAFLILPIVLAVPNLEEYRPEEFELGQEVEGSFDIFWSLLILTAVLIGVKFLRIKLSWIIDLAVFFSGFMFGSIFKIGLFLGLLLLALRKTRIIELFNISSFVTIICFAMLIAPFITPSAAMMLLALLSLYDVIGVLYLPYIKFLWLEINREINLDAIAIIFKNGMVGAGDFALPLVFSLSFGMVGLFSVPLIALGFWLNQRLAKRFGAFPGVPFQALFAYVFFIALS